MLKKILVCLDGSKFAERILPHVIERARRFNSKVVLIKVITVNIGSYATGVPEQPSLLVPGLLEKNIRIEETKDRLYLDSVTKQLREMGLDVDWVTINGITRGSIAGTITTYATQNEVDLIMMATHGHSFWKRFVFGSVAESLIRNSNTPVLVVKPKDAEAKEDAFGEMPQASLT